MDWFMCISKLFMFCGIIIVYIYCCKILYKSLYLIYWLFENGGLVFFYVDLELLVYILDCNYINKYGIFFYYNIIRMFYIVIRSVLKI